MTMAVRTSTLAGPTLTALLAAFVDVGTLLLGIGLLWLVAALLPGRGAPAAGSVAGSTAPAPRASLRAEFVDGIREARRHPGSSPDSAP